MFTLEGSSGRTLFVWTTIILAKCCFSLHLTNMTAPVLQDPRKTMELHCRFDMGGEELYAVKWYKDDHEFFRYTPAAPITITQYPVPGVQVDRQHSKCSFEGCDLVLKALSRPESSGAYRCEVSTEAPAFRLASQTHNVTVAAVPEEDPKLEGLADSYLAGDLLVAQCTSGLGDPKPILAWYVNKQQITGKSVHEKLSPAPKLDSSKINLLSTSSELKLSLDQQLTQNRPKVSIEITCKSLTQGISTTVAPPRSSSKVVTVLNQHQLVNNEKLHSPFSGAWKNSCQISVVFIVTLLKWC